jgi:hypothetical protein
MSMASLSSKRSEAQAVIYLKHLKEMNWHSLLSAQTGYQSSCDAVSQVTMQDPQQI